MPIILRPYGNRSKSLQMTPLAMGVLESLKNFMGYRELQQGLVFRSLPDGTRIMVKSVMGIDQVFITTPTGEPYRHESIKVSPEDVFLAYNIPDRNGAWDVAANQKVVPYTLDIPTESWAPGEPYWPNPPGMPEEDTPTYFSTGSLQGDPVIYWFNHADPGPHPERDTRINVLKSWTYNVATETSGGGFLGVETVTIFHRKSTSFLDQIRGSVNPYNNTAESIEVYHGSGLGGGRPVVKRVYSNVWGTMNFYVAPNGDFSIVYLFASIGGGGSTRYRLDHETYDKDGNLQSHTTEWSGYMTIDFTDGLGPMSVAYDGSDYYCTLNCGDIQGGNGGAAVFTPSNIYTSTTKLYDYDPVNRVIVSMDKVGHVSGDTVPTQWWLGAVSWYDFVRSRWYSMDMLFEGDGGGQEFTLFDGVDNVFVQTDAAAYSGGSIVLDLNPNFWCRYDGGWNRGNPLYEFPLPIYPWNIHYTVGGYQRICTLDAYTNNRPLFDLWTGFSQLSGTLPDLTEYSDVQYRKFDGSLIIASAVPGGPAKWTTNGLILNVQKITTTTTVEEGVA